MRTKKEIIEWVQDSKSTSSQMIALIELLADIRDLLIKSKTD
jgi:hypothetical protein